MEHPNLTVRLGFDSRYVIEGDEHLNLINVETGCFAVIRTPQDIGEYLKEIFAKPQTVWSASVEGTERVDAARMASASAWLSVLARARALKYDVLFDDLWCTIVPNRLLTVPIPAQCGVPGLSYGFGCYLEIGSNLLKCEIPAAGLNIVSNDTSLFAQLSAPYPSHESLWSQTCMNILGNLGLEHSRLPETNIETFKDLQMNLAFHHWTRNDGDLTKYGSRNENRINGSRVTPRLAGQYHSFPLANSVYEGVHGLFEILSKRKSTRRSDRFLDFNLLGSFLRVLSGTFLASERRIDVAPSAGNMRAMVFDLVVVNCVGLPEGVYRLDVERGGVQELPPAKAEIAAWVSQVRMFLGETSDCTPQVGVAISVDLDLITERYARVGYANAIKEAGCYIQLAYMTAAALELGICALGGGPSSFSWMRDAESTSSNRVLISEFVLWG